MGGAVSSGISNDDLINKLVDARYIKTPAVEKVFRAVDRAFYFLPNSKATAYRDIAWKQGNLHISAPCIYSEVMENLELQPGLSFLNVGSGTGYLNTIVGLILGPRGINHGIEIYQDVIDYANSKLIEFKGTCSALDSHEFCEPIFVCGNSFSIHSDLLYDRVYCGAACTAENLQFIRSLIKIGGILVVPCNDELLKLVRISENEWKSEDILPVSFSTLINPDQKDEDKIKMPERSPLRLDQLCRSVIRCILREIAETEHPELIKAPRRRPTELESDDDNNADGLRPARCNHRRCVILNESRVSLNYMPGDRRRINCFAVTSNGSDESEFLGFRAIECARLTPGRLGGRHQSVGLFFRRLLLPRLPIDGDVNNYSSLDSSANQSDDDDNEHNNEISDEGSSSNDDNDDDNDDDNNNDDNEMAPRKIDSENVINDCSSSSSSSSSSGNDNSDCMMDYEQSNYCKHSPRVLLSASTTERVVALDTKKKLNNGKHHTKNDDKANNENFAKTNNNNNNNNNNNDDDDDTKHDVVVKNWMNNETDDKRKRSAEKFEFGRCGGGTRQKSVVTEKPPSCSCFFCSCPSSSSAAAAVVGKSQLVTTATSSSTQGQSAAAAANSAADEIDSACSSYHVKKFKNDVAVSAATQPPVTMPSLLNCNNNNNDEHSTSNDDNKQSDSDKSKTNDSGSFLSSDSDGWIDSDFEDSNVSFSNSLDSETLTADDDEDDDRLARAAAADLETTAKITYRSVLEEKIQLLPLPPPLKLYLNYNRAF